MTVVVGDVAQVIDCEHRTAPREKVDPFGFSIGTRAVRNGRIALTDAKPVSKETYLAWTRRATPASGDLIFSREAPMGEVGAVPDEAPVCLGQRTVLLRLDRERIDQRFMLYALMSPPSQQWISKNSAGSTVLHINVADVRRIPIPLLPPLAEQRRIVAILEDHLSRLDAAEDYLRAAQRRSKGLHNQLLTHALNGVACEPMPLRDLLAIGLSNGRSVPTQAGGFPVLRLTALRGGRVDLAERKDGAWTAEDAERFLVSRGDFLVSRGNGSLHLVGRGALVEGDPDPIAFPDTLIRVRPSADRIDPQYLALVWNSPAVRRQIEKAARTTAGIYKINQKDLGSVRVPTPSLADQSAIVTAVEGSRDALRQLTDECEHAELQGLALRRSILAAAFSGRLTGSAKGLPDAEEMMSA